MTQCVISSHVCGTHHAMLLSHMPRSDCVEITTWSLQQRRAPTQVPLREHLRKQEKAEYRLALNQHARVHTSTHIPEVHCQLLQWLAGLSLQHPSLHSDRVVADCCQDVSVVYRRQSEQNREAWLPHPLATQVEHTHTQSCIILHSLTISLFLFSQTYRY